MFYGYGIDLDNRIMNLFMKGVNNIGYKAEKYYAWNAGKIVDLLPNSSDVSVKFLTQKTSFLVLIACGRSGWYTIF